MISLIATTGLRRPRRDVLTVQTREQQQDQSDFGQRSQWISADPSRAARVAVRHG